MKTAWIALCCLALAAGFAIGREPSVAGAAQETPPDDAKGKLPQEKGRADDEKAAKDVNDPAWHDTARTIARHYRLWQPLESTLRWAPELCMMPPAPSARLSAARAKTPHARKLYALYAKDPVAYGARPTGLEPEGPEAEILARFEGLEQVVVKEAWKPVERESGPPQRGVFHDHGPSGLLPVEKDGKWFAPGDRAGLFVMFRPRETEHDTDAGWVYTTIEPDGKVSGAGRMASCMECHARHEDRLFGLAKDSPARRD